MPTIEELGQKVKAKYPGSYDSLDDAEVGKRVKQKFPNAYQDFTESSPAPQAAPQGATGLKGFSAGILKGIGSTLAGAEKLGGKILDLPLKAMGVKPPVDKGLLQVQKEKGTFTPTTTSQKVGYGAEQLAEFFAPIPGGAKAKVAAKALPLAQRVLARGALEAGELAGKTAIQTGGDVKETAKAAAIGGVFGGLSPLAKAAAEKVAPKLVSSAEKSMSQALGPTTKEMKLKTAKVAPELVKRGFAGLSRSGLATKAAGKLEAAGEEIEKTLATIPPKTRINVRPILQSLKNAKSEYIVPGTKVVADPLAVKSIENVEKVLKQLGKDASFESIRALRQIWDKSVAKRGGFLMDEVSNLNLMAKREASNAIRSELAKRFPDLDKVNKEFSFWKNVTDVLDETVLRTTAQAKPLGEQLVTAAGAAGGLARGGITGAVSGAFVMSQLKKAVSSAAWKTTSAILKNRLAEALSTNNLEEAMAIISRIVASGTTNR